MYLFMIHNILNIHKATYWNIYSILKKDNSMYKFHDVYLEKKILPKSLLTKLKK